MAEVTVEHVLEEVRTLTREDQARVRDALERMLEQPRPPMTEDEFEAEMVRKGILSAPPRNAPPAPVRDCGPITIEGKPLSETIIEERR